MQARGGNQVPYVLAAIVPLGEAQKVVAQMSAEGKADYLKGLKDPL